MGHGGPWQVTLQHPATCGHQELMRGMLVSWEGGGELGAMPALGSHCLLEHREMAGLPFTFLHSELAPWVLCLEQCLLFTTHFFFYKGF